MDQLQVSKFVKQYILSINNEINDSFKSTLDSIKNKMIEEVIKSPLQSNYLSIRPILDKELSNFVENLITILDFYSEGIFHSGKTVARKKLKLEILKEKGKKYSFNYNDELFLEKFRFDKLNKLSHNLKNASVKYVVELVTNKIQGQWSSNDDNDYQYFIYLKQQMNDEEKIEKIVNVVLDVVSSIYPEIVELATKEAISLFKRGQLEEYKTLGISKIRIKSSHDANESCPICRVRNLDAIDINNVITDLGVDDEIIHPLCKISIEPVINYDDIDFNDPLNKFNKVFRENGFSEQINHFNNDRFDLSRDIGMIIGNISCKDMQFKNIPIEVEDSLNKLFNKIKIYLASFIKPLNFEFVNDAVEDESWFNKVKDAYMKDKSEFHADNETNFEQDMNRRTVEMFRNGNDILISNFALLNDSIENIVIREIFRNIEIPDLSWWKKSYAKKMKDKKIGEGLTLKSSHFVNFLATQSLEDFILESIVAYVNNPKFLQCVDKEVFDKLDSDLFNGIKFF